MAHFKVKIAEHLGTADVGVPAMCGVDDTVI